MVVLMRRVGESVTIGNDITVTVVESRNGIVRLGFEAPDTLTITRAETKHRPAR